MSVPHLARKYVRKKYDAAELRSGWHGWRAQIDEGSINLPSQTELNVYTTDDALDLSNPRTRHVLANWTPVAHKGEAKRPAKQESPDTRRDIAASGRKILDAVSSSTDVTFITGFGNVGDQLIHAGARRLLAGVPYKEARVRRAPKDVIEGLGGHTALVTGGGGWCKPFHRIWPAVLPTIEERFERVIVLPSTIDASFEPVRKVLAHTKALVFARERESHRQLRGLCETDLAHDTAFFYDFGPYEEHRGEGVLRAYRTDGESATGGEVPAGNDDISKTCVTLDEFLWRIARHEVVETDRAHVMIAAAMLGKRVKYRVTNYHKVPAIAEYALRGFDVERLADAGPRGGTGDYPTPIPGGADVKRLEVPNPEIGKPPQDEEQGGTVRRLLHGFRATLMRAQSPEPTPRSGGGPPPSPFVVGVGHSGTTLLRVWVCPASTDRLPLSHSTSSQSNLFVL